MGLRGVLRVGAIFVLLIACLPCWAVARLVGGADWWVRFFLRSAAHILGIHTRVLGRPVGGRVLYVANHLSWLDILALGSVINPRFIAKAEIARWPLIGWIATIGGTVFISRDRRSATRAQADAVVQALAGARPVVLFAEGATGDGVTVSPFRPALFAAAVEGGTLVQPIAIDYGPRSAEVAWPDGTGFAKEMNRILARPGPIVVTLHFAEPLDPHMLDRKVLAERAHASVMAALGR